MSFDILICLFIIIIIIMIIIMIIIIIIYSISLLSLSPPPFFLPSFSLFLSLSLRYPQTPTGKRPKAAISLFSNLSISSSSSPASSFPPLSSTSSSSSSSSFPSPCFGKKGRKGVQRGRGKKEREEVRREESIERNEEENRHFIGPSAENEYLDKEKRRSFYLLDHPHDIMQIGGGEREGGGKGGGRGNRFGEDFESLKMLERGDNGEVYMVCHRISGVVYAIKKSVKKNRMKSVNCPYNYDYNMDVFREARALSVLEHSNIVRYYYSWVEETSLYIQLEYCEGGSVEGLLRRRERMSIKNLCVILKQMTSVLEYLQSSKLVHCDIKPSNILITKKKKKRMRRDGGIGNYIFGEGEGGREGGEGEGEEEEVVYKLCDFGTIQREREVDLLVDDVEVGSGAYLPSFLSNISSSVDVFSLGLTMFELFCEGRIAKKDLKSVNHREEMEKKRWEELEKEKRERGDDSDEEMMIEKDNFYHFSSQYSPYPTPTRGKGKGKGKGERERGRREEFVELVLGMISTDYLRRPCVGEIMRRVELIERMEKE